MKYQIYRKSACSCQKEQAFFIVIFHALLAEKQQKSNDNPQFSDSIFPIHDDYSTVILESSIF